MVPKTENSPPLWYLLEWFDYRLFGSSAFALRLPSAIAGIALVPVAWGIGRELADRAAAIACAALVTVGPLFVWYSQEARAYGLFMFMSGLAMLRSCGCCASRAAGASRSSPSPRRCAC